MNLKTRKVLYDRREELAFNAMLRKSGGRTYHRNTDVYAKEKRDTELHERKKDLL